MRAQGAVGFDTGGLETVGPVNAVCGWVVGFERRGDTGAPAAFGVAGVEEDAVWWGGEDAG